VPSVFNASNAVEAHLIVDLLRRSHVEARIEGEFLGHAIGDLPVIGLMRVVVDDQDAVLARSVIAQWESGAFALTDDEPVGSAVTDDDGG
jgi:hypothetical protein